MVKELGTKLNDVGSQSFEYLVGYEFVSSLVAIIITALFCAIALYIGRRFLSINKEVQSLKDSILKKEDESYSWEFNEWSSEIKNELINIHLACWIVFIILLACSLILIGVLANQVPDLVYPEAEVLNNLLRSCGR